MKRVKALVMIMVMVMSLTGFTSTVEAKTKTSITVTNKTTGKKVGKKVTLKTGEKLQLKVKYGKKNVTKKVKYKTSTKKVSVNKKGKLTAKQAGICLVTIKYKKKTKKIKVTVKAPVQNDSSIDETPIVTEPTTETQDEKVQRYVEATKSPTPLYPDSPKDWEFLTFESDVPLTLHTGDRITPEILDHLYLVCMSCSYDGHSSGSELAFTKHVPYREVINYSTDELNDLVEYYRDTSIDTPKHKHEYVLRLCYSRSTGIWTPDYRCTICNCYRN